MADETKKGGVEATGDTESNDSKPEPIHFTSDAVMPDVSPADQVGLTKAGPVGPALTPQPLADDTDIDVGLPKHAPAPPLPIAEPTAPSATPTSGDIHNDIEKILREVKLPERRAFKGAADAKPVMPPPLSAIPGGMILPPQQGEQAKVESAGAQSTPSSVASVHTLKDDLQHAVKDKKMSLVRAVSLEQDRKKRSAEVAEVDFGRTERKKRVTGILFTAGLLFFLGLAALFGVYTVMMSNTGLETQQFDSIVFAEQSVALPISNTTPNELKRRVAASREAPVGALGSITRVVPLIEVSNTDPPQQAVAKLPEFLSAIGANPPNSLEQALGDDFFFGIHVVDKNSLVLVMPVVSYDHAFAGMLEWESTMNADLSPAFTAVPSLIYDANGIPSQREFSDNILRNYDVRELKDDSGQVRLYYSFPSPRLLIIAESPYSFPELLSRLQSMQRL